MIKTAYRWETNWKITLLFVLLLPLLLRLGFWQLQRAEEKRELQQRIELRAAQAPLEVSRLLSLADEELNHRRVRLDGVFDNDTVYLLDNQVFNGKVGYQLLQRFYASNDSQDTQAFLVNRGWIAGFPDRRLPELPVVTGRGSVLASVYIPASRPVLLAEESLAQTWPQVIQSVDMAKIRAQLGEEVYRYELRLQDGQWGALAVDWPVVNTGPEKHQGYAVQWFAMSAALVVCWLLASVKKRTGDPKN